MYLYELQKILLNELKYNASWSVTINAFFFFPSRLQQQFSLNTNLRYFKSIFYILYRHSSSYPRLVEMLIPLAELPILAAVFTIFEQLEEQDALR